MKLLPLRELLALLLFCTAAVIPFHPEIDGVRVDYHLTLRMSSSAGGELKLYFDDGNGLRESLSSFAPVAVSSGLVRYRLNVPSRTLRGIRFDPINAPATVTIADAQIVTAEGAVVHRFSPTDFVPEYEIEAMTIVDDSLVVVTTPGGIDPQLRLPLAPPLELKPSSLAPLTRSVVRALVLFAFAVGGLVALRRSATARERASRLRAWALARPKSATAAIALAAALLSCAPVAFLGRSFTSPNFSDGTVLLYERFPTLPGYSDTRMAHAAGSDVGAIAWHHHPLSIIEHRALVRDIEIPLWNRYNSAGVTLLGQGQSMFGDPLHFIPVLANGAAWAWDLKYIVARWLFALGSGVIVWRLTTHAPSAWVTAFASAFIGFFLYRVNHPANFSICYAPWMLHAWIGIVRAPGARAALPWIGALVLANFAELASGTAKEAYMLLISLNLTGTIMLLATRAPWLLKAAKFCLLGVGGVLFVMVSAPIWTTFLDALAQGYTSYDNPAAFQILPSLLPGLFDEIFYRPLHRNEWTWNPSANFLILAGLLFRVVTIRRIPPDRMELALAAGAGIAFTMAFGIVPPQWIARVPFLANVAHIDNTFSCVLIIHLIALAGIGFHAAFARLATREGRGDIVLCAVLLVAVFVPYLALTQVVHREPFGPGTVVKLLTWGQRVPLAPLVWVSVVLLPAAAIILLIVTRRALIAGRWTATAIALAATCLLVLFWRHAHQPGNTFHPYTFSPGPRVDFHAPSEAIEHIRATSREPWRVVGFEANLFPGWSAAYDLETIAGPDAVSNPLYRQLLDACGLHRIWDWRIVVRAESLSRLHRAYDALNVRHYLDLRSGDTRIGETLRQTLQADFDVYESPTAWPRAFFTDRVARIRDAADLAARISTGDGRPFATMQEGETSPLPELSGDLADRVVVPASDYALTTNSTAFTVEAPGPGVIVLHEAWLRRDFRVTINGDRARYLRVNHAFKGVAVDRAGTYRVEFTYWPRRFTLALIAATIATLVLIAFGAVGLRDHLYRRRATLSDRPT